MLLFFRQKHKLVTVADGSSNTCRRVCTDAEKPKDAAGGPVPYSALWCCGWDSATTFLPWLLALLGSTSWDTRGRLQGWRRGQGSCSFLFAFCSYCCHPALARGLTTSIDFHLQLISASSEQVRGDPSSEDGVPNLCGPSQKPQQYQLQSFNTLSSGSDFHHYRTLRLSFRLVTQPLPFVLPALKMRAASCSCCLCAVSVPPMPSLPLPV